MRLGKVLLALVMLGAAGLGPLERREGQTEAMGLEDFFETGRILQDRNGDGHIDFVNARFVLGPEPSDGAVAAAANIAARLGFETSAMDLPLTREGDGIPIVVGHGGMERTGLPRGRTGVDLSGLPRDRTGVDLEPGLGVVSLLDLGEGPAVLVVGGDERGLMAASTALAARAPKVWNERSAAMPEIVAAIEKVARAGGAEGGEGGKEDGAGGGTEDGAEGGKEDGADDADAAGSSRVTARIIRFLQRDEQAGMARLDVELRVAAEDLERTAKALRDAADPEKADEEADAEKGAEADKEEEAEKGAEADKEEEAEGEREAEGAKETEGEEAAEEAEAEAPTLRFPGLRLLRIYLTAGEEPPVVIHVEGDAEEIPAPPGRRPGPGNKGSLDLANLYGNRGFLGDSNGNGIPDRVDVLLSPSGDVAAATVDLAARLALESVGVSIPIALPPDRLGEPKSAPTLVLIGGGHPLVRRLVEEEKLELPELSPGEGVIQVVHEAFEKKRALVVVGADPRGLERAVRQLAQRLPHIWVRGKGETTLADVRHDLWMAASSRSPAGQAATALYKLDRIAQKLAPKDLESATVSVHLEEADPGFSAYLRERLGDLLPADRLEVEVGDIDVQNAELLIDDEFDIPSEVEEFWRLFRSEVIPRVERGSPAVVEGILSEPPEIREGIEERALRELIDAGASGEGSRVQILSAYKQGYSWLYDSVRPRLEGRPVGEITIRFAEVGPPKDWPQQAMYTPIRWLMEAFPIDEVLARDLGVELEKIRFEMGPKDAPAYEVVVTSEDGAEILRDTFTPKYVLRPYFDRFPEYEKVRVTTGWIHAMAGGEEVVDQRIVTDLERFWDHYQSQTLMEIYDYVMRITEGRPGGSGPFFGELRVDVSLSEPDYEIGIDKERISPMEALHEELYFGTIHFFSLLGRVGGGAALSYPGRIIPIVRPRPDGKTGRAKITFTGFGAAQPRVEVKYTERGGWEKKERREIRPLSLDPPTPLATRVAAGTEGLERTRFRVEVDFRKNRREELITRTSESFLDAVITSAEQVATAFQYVDSLRTAGLYRSELAHRHFGAIDLAVNWDRKLDPDSQIVATLRANGSPPERPSIEKLVPSGYAWKGGELVQWETPIPPPESAEILAKMSTFPEANVYPIGESYLGKTIWAMDLHPPIEASHLSQAKLATLKPTVVYSAREHANEVSSTSHVLKLAEMILTDTAYEEVLDKVNVVIHPITNPDGAQLAYDLYRITPDHMLHAGYLGALGVQATAGGGNDPIYPESKVRPKLRATWFPDIFLNPHGYPSHEWVQIFSEYAAWISSRSPGSRAWWGMRGWFIPGFSYPDDPGAPELTEAAAEIRDRITEKINGLPDIRALNRRAYARYERYGLAWDVQNFKMHLVDSVLINMPIQGLRRRGSPGNPAARVTIWSGITEAPTRRRTAIGCGSWPRPGWRGTRRSWSISSGGITRSNATAANFRAA